MRKIKLNFHFSKLIKVKLDICTGIVEGSCDQGSHGEQLVLLNGVNKKLNDLVVVTAPSNYKILFDITSKLYDDEVSRYRFLEEKSSKLLAVIVFLLTSMMTVFYWVYQENSRLFSLSVVFLLLVALLMITVSLGFILGSYSVTIKPAMEISDQNIDEAGIIPDYDRHYLNYLTAYRDFGNEYREKNKQKGRSVKLAQKFLVYYFYCAAIVILFLCLGQFSY